MQPIIRQMQKKTQCEMQNKSHIYKAVADRPVSSYASIYPDLSELTAPQFETAQTRYVPLEGDNAENNVVRRSQCLCMVKPMGIFLLVSLIWIIADLVIRKILASNGIKHKNAYNIEILIGVDFLFIGLNLMSFCFLCNFQCYTHLVAHGFVGGTFIAQAIIEYFKHTHGSGLIQAIPKLIKLYNEK